MPHHDIVTYYLDKLNERIPGRRRRMNQALGSDTFKRRVKVPSLRNEFVVGKMYDPCIDESFENGRRRFRAMIPPLVCPIRMIELRASVVFLGYPGILQRHRGLLYRHKRDCDTLCDLRGCEDVAGDAQI